MKKGPKGFHIDCAHCRKEFESLGLRCCTTECERAHREREENLALLWQIFSGTGFPNQFFNDS